MRKIIITENQLDKIIGKTLVENLLSDYRPHTTNKAKMVSINEVNAKSLIQRHSDNGYVAISPCRGGSDFGLNPKIQPQREKLNSINKERIKLIIADIKSSGYAYTPVYGGFIENKGTENETNVYERSFIVYNYDKNGKPLDFSNLKSFALDLCRKYNQDSVLVKAPNEKAQYITQDGSVDTTFENGTIFNDFSQEYFTDLHKNTHKNPTGKPTRFTYTESYINPAPQCYSERHTRHINGEIFLSN